MKNNHLVTGDSGVNGIYRCKLLTGIDSSDIRVYIPGVNNINPFNSDGSLNLEKYKSHKNSFPKVQWCCYNVESKVLENQDPVCWCMFENGDFRKPVVISYAIVGGNRSIYNYIDFNDTEVSTAGTDNSLDDKTTYIFNKLISMGASVGGAASIIGAMWGESARTMSPTITNGNGALGLGQWLYDRKSILINGGKVGSKYWDKPTNPYDTDTQIEYYVFELKYLGRFKAPTWDDLCEQINDEKSVRNMVFAIVRYFETPFLYDSPNALKAGDPNTFNNYYIPCVTKAITYFNKYNE